MLYADKKKALDYFSVSAPVAEAQNNQELKSVTNIIQNFENPKVSAKYSLQTPIFYSNAQFAVQNIKQEKATPEQWLKMIEKNGGLKAGEDKWLGLSDWLKASDKKTLTKDEVLQYIAENDIQIEEVSYGEPEYISENEIYDETAFMDAANTLRAYIHENVHRIIEKLGVDEKTLEDILAEGLSLKPNITQSYIADYLNDPKHEQGEETLAYAIGDRILYSKDREKLLNAIEGNIAAKELFENQKISVPLRDSYIEKIVNELHNEYKSRREGEDSTGADSTNRGEINKVDNQGLWREYSEAGPSGDIGRRGRVLAPTRYSLQSGDMPFFNDNGDIITFALQTRAAYKDQKDKLMQFLEGDILVDDILDSFKISVPLRDKIIKNILIALQDGYNNKHNADYANNRDNYGAAQEETFRDRRGSKYNGDSRRDILTPTRYSLQSGDMPFFNDNGDIITFDIINVHL